MVNRGLMGQLAKGAAISLAILLCPLAGWAQKLDFATFLGGSLYDRAQGVAADGSGATCVAINTFSTNMPTTVGVYDRTNNGGQDAHVAKLSGDGKSLIWGSYLGGSAEEGAMACASGRTALST